MLEKNKNHMELVHEKKYAAKSKLYTMENIDFIKENWDVRDWKKEPILKYSRQWPERLERGGPCWLLKLRQMGTQKVHKKGSFLGWFVGLVVLVQEIFCPALTALVGPVKNMFFLTVHYFTSFVLITQKLGRQSCRVACLLIFVSGGDSYS
jgi:hypothetical protein